MNPHRELSLQLVAESERRVAVTWRLLLRCLWKWLLRKNIIENQCHPTVDRKSERHVTNSQPLKNAVGDCAPRKPGLTSRSIYREVMQKRRPSSSDTPQLGSVDLDDAHPAAEEVPSSASFIVLRSSLPLMFCLVFIRRLYHEGCVVRRDREASARTHWGFRMQRLAFVHWKRTAREQIRWRRWLLRRCVDHWCRFTAKAKELKDVLLQYRHGLLTRSCAFTKVNSLRRARYFETWRSKANEMKMRREEVRLAEYMYAAKRSTRSAVFVRDSMFSSIHEPSERSTTPQPHEGHHLQSWGDSTLKRFCFLHWKRKTEDRLEAQLGESVWRQQAMKKCFESWLVRYIAVKAARLDDTSLEHCCGSPVVSVVECGPTYPPRALAYKQSCFDRYLAKKLVNRSFVVWKEKTQVRHADEWYVVALTSKVLTRWIDRLVGLRNQRQIVGSCFALWHRKFLRRQRSRVAIELHRALQLEKLWRRWKASAALQSLRRSFETRFTAMLLCRWRQAARFSVAGRESQYRTMKRLFSNWRNRTAQKVSCYEADVVAEAFCQHKMMRCTFARWALAAQEIVLERNSLLVFDELRGERLRRKLFAHWVGRTKIGVHNIHIIH